MTGGYRAADFDYDCPPDLIAQYPPTERGSSRLLTVDRAQQQITHGTFAEFPSLLAPGDCLVVNESRVIPARLHAIRENGRPAEILLVHEEPDGTWQAMVHPGGKLKAGRRLRFASPPGSNSAYALSSPPGPLSAYAESSPPVPLSAYAERGDPTVEIVEVLANGLRRVRFHGADARTIMDRYGAVPLPPYITRAPEHADIARYQTVYARTDGSVAAPTAGLHFTPQLLDTIRAMEVTIAAVTLHVGPGTFKPVEADDPAGHTMHSEWYEVPAETGEIVHATKARGGKVWAVGTTAARVLETRGRVDAWTRGRASGWTDLFIYPPCQFQVVDGLLTNFHLPRSTLLMLVAAFAGYDLTTRAYREAVAAGYRLYSYGDAMAIR